MLSSRSIFFLASTVGAWWYLSRDIGAKRRRKPRIPLFRKHCPECEEADTEEDLWDLKQDEDDLEDDIPFHTRKPKQNKDGEGSPPRDSPRKPKKLHAEKDDGNKLEDQDRENDEGGKKKNRIERVSVTGGEEDNRKDIPEKDDVKDDLASPPKGIGRRICIKTPTHTTEIIRTKTGSPSRQAREDSDMFYGLLSLYSREKGASTPKTPQAPREACVERRESVMLCRESLDQIVQDEGDPVKDLRDTPEAPRTRSDPCRNTSRKLQRELFKS